jgi:hypothetical protein
MTEIEFRALPQICKTYNIPRCLPSASNNGTTGNYQPGTIGKSSGKFKKGKKEKRTKNAPPLNRILRNGEEGELKCPNNNSDHPLRNGIQFYRAVQQP